MANDLQTRVDSKMGIVEQVNACLRTGHYSRALDLLQGADGFSDHARFAELEKLAQDGIQRNSEAQRLITESQELFARQNPAEAIELLRQAYDLDKKNYVARSILGNALVEHAQSLVETDWLEAEKLINQALAVNPAHPTARTVVHAIVEKKKNSPVDDWVSQASKLQSSGDFFKALAWVAEGLAIHPDDAKLLHLQEEIQRDRAARARQTRRRDLEELRKIEREIGRETDSTAKQALGEHIQAVAVRYWTDGEIITIANGLLFRLGLVDQESTSLPGKNAPVIFHVPRAISANIDASSINGPKPPVADNSAVPASKPQSNSIATRAASAGVELDNPQLNVKPNTIERGSDSPDVAAPVVTPEKVPTAEPQIPFSIAPVATEAAEEGSATAVGTNDPQIDARKYRGYNPKTLVVACALLTIVVLAVFAFARRRTVPPKVETSSPALIASTPAVEKVATSAPSASATPTSNTEAPAPAVSASTDPDAEKVPVENKAPEPLPVLVSTETSSKLNTLIVVAGQDNAKVFLDGKLQAQLTRAGQLRIENLERKNYVVQVSKSGFQDPPPQEIRLQEGKEAKLTFSLQPPPSSLPRQALLSIQGGVPGTAIFIDQTLAGTVQPDGTLMMSNVSAGDHTVELRKERFKSRQFKEHFVAGETISLAAAEATLEAISGELKINFTPSDASVAIVKGDTLAMVRSGVPLNLASGTYTITTRNADRFTRSSTVDVVAGQSKTLDLALAPNGMSKWEDPDAWKPEGNSFIRKGGDYVLYGVVPTSGTFVFSAMPAKGRVVQWVVNYIDSKNYILFQIDDDSFRRMVIHNGEKRDEIIVPDKGEKKSFRTLRIHISSTEVVHQIQHGNSWTVLDRWSQPGTDISVGKFGFYIAGNDQVALSGFAHYADLNIR